ncbi:MAG: peptidyl-prolyl cis-trans isomerase [Salinicola sp.]|uniref:peptidylprolyl isomerase n=1 Tax=Salinicola sp. TaxID=1978524 RepID=UPI001DFDB312|nr:peptidylprolyl isomerase [Salinicola sp.]NRB57540.1 peptidyl-prolyl cis-trans isomerase [Salinicola sp.]
MRKSLIPLCLSALTLFSLPALADADHPHVRLETSQGAIEVELDAQAAPRTVENFLRYVDEDFYAGTVFHRVMQDFMIQGGGMTADLEPKETHAPIPLEKSGLDNTRGTIAMARTANPDSATSQFFINLVDNGALNYRDLYNPGYTVFGHVVSGMDVVDEIAGTPTGRQGPHADVPRTPITIESVKRID